MLLRPALRERLREPGPYVACVLATLVFLPVLRWNAAHDWISFRFQLQHGLGTPPRGSSLKRELDLIGGQLLLVSPILFVITATAVWRTLRRPIDDARFALAVVATASWVFFVYSALRKSVEANWPAPSYVPAIALLAALGATPARNRWLRRGVLLAAAFSVLLLSLVCYSAFADSVPAGMQRPLSRTSRELASWDRLAARVHDVRGILDAGGGRSWVGADRYQDVGELAYHMPGEPALCMCFSGRSNQYALWPGYPQLARQGDGLVLVLDDTPDVHVTAAVLAPYFSSLVRGPLAPLTRGRDTVGVRRLWVLAGYRGGWPARVSP